MIRIAFIGAGSIGFTRKLVADLLAVPEFSGIELAFTDINRRNLDRVARICRADIAANGLGKTVKLVATTDRRAALRGAKYVFCVVRIGGLEAFATDIDIPLRYGIDQCVGDTLCAGGIMYGQRGIAALLDFCKDIREVAAPGCILFNYANPMAMLTWAANTHGGVRCIGLCHGVQHGHTQIADVLGAKSRSEVDIVCAGINHQTWYVKIRYAGREIGGGELLAAFERHPRYSRTEKVRIDMLRRFGVYSTESNGHLSEYVPWYRKRPAEIRKWIDLGEWIHGETGGYLRVCTEGRHWFEEEFGRGRKIAPLAYAPENRSDEHGSRIVEALETGRIYRGHFNTINRGVIPNLPDDCVIEAPGYVDRNGISMPVVGDLPPGCAAVCHVSVNVQRLAVAAAVSGDDALLRQAFMLDPLTGAVCNPPEIWQLVDDMLVAGEKWLPQYGPTIAAAKHRLATGPRLRARPGKPAAAKKTRTLSELRKARANPRAGH
ncbi:alpha-galactosidase [Opitutaceae bacterium TAV5]|nr:alpha-galactosidase [Opitutaceae bacterium TAV5]